ncbi:MAG: hypothetical protein JRI92_07165, partial [Deltaproteobacteria bacterium]|nr:hypothetical protein [Deltaproteobacteria bacterium]
MLNGDEAMSPAEFAKLMGAYPQPAENPLPAYGGYMDNSPANFAWVNNNAYFGAESKYDELLELSNKAKERYMDVVEEWEIEDFCDNYDLDYNDSNDRQRAISKYLDDVPFDRIVEALDEDDQKRYYELMEAEGEKKNCGCGKDPCITYGAETFEAETLHEKGDYRIIAENDDMWDENWTDSAKEMADLSGVIASDDGKNSLKDFALTDMEIPEGVDFDAETFESEGGMITITGVVSKLYFDELMDGREPFHDVEWDIQEYDEDAETFESPDGYCPHCHVPGNRSTGRMELRCSDCGGGMFAETFEAPYAGVGSLFGIGQNTGLEGFTTSELTTSSAIHGDFDEASLNYSGHQNFEVRAETKKGWSCKYCG